MEIVSNNNTPSFLPDALNSESIHMTASDLVLNAFIHTGFFIQSKNGGSSVGLYIGYMISRPSDNWNYYGNATQLQEQALDGFYIRLKIGGGGMK